MRSASGPASRARKCCRRTRPGYRRRSWVAGRMAKTGSQPSTRDPLSSPGSVSAPESLPSPRGAHLEMVGAVLAGDGLERIAEIATQHAGVPVAGVVPRLATPGEGWGPYERYGAGRPAGGEPGGPSGGPAGGA